MGKKTLDFKTRRVALRGRKSKAGGQKIKSDSIIYTPATLTTKCHKQQKVTKEKR